MALSNEPVMVAILAKDKAHCLPLFLKCLEAQTIPKSQINIYIRSNNNTDDTEKILKNWVKAHQSEYASFYEDYSPVDKRLEEFKQHQWNGLRFKILAKIRQDSIEYAKDHGWHYFVIDCDNFVRSHTLAAMMETGVSVVGPMLRTGIPNGWKGKSQTNNDYANPRYSNYHYKTDPNGYFKGTFHYDVALDCKIKGLLEVEVIHCTYFIRKEALPFVAYEDGSGRYEYVIFSHSLRKNKVSQYLDNRSDYGFLTFAENPVEMKEMPWLGGFEKSIKEALNGGPKSKEAKNGETKSERKRSNKKEG